MGPEVTTTAPPLVGIVRATVTMPADVAATSSMSEGPGGLTACSAVPLPLSDEFCESSSKVT